MSEHVQTHVLERAISAARAERLAAEQVPAQTAPDRLQYLSTHYQVPIWGIATDITAWTKFSIGFDVQFPYMPEQHDLAHDTPYFSYGVDVSGVPHPNEDAPDPNNPDSLVAIHCQIIDWARDLDIDSVIGAVLGYGAQHGGNSASGDVKFSGFLHLNFHGYGHLAHGDVPPVVSEPPV